MSRRTWPGAASAIAVAALLGGCGLGFGDEMVGTASATGVAAGPAVPEAATGTGQGQGAGGGATTGAGNGSAASTAGASGSTQPSSGSQAAGVTEIRDGVWDVGDAGQVQFSVRQGQLRLMSSTPASGWQKAQPPVQQPNAIEVDFTQGTDTTWTFRAQLSGSQLQITKQLTILKAADGSYPVGGAGSVSFIGSGSQLKLTNVSPEAGWSVAQQQSSPTSIVVSFKQGAGTAQFTATTSGTDVTVTTSQQLSGPVPAT